MRLPKALRELKTLRLVCKLWMSLLKSKFSLRLVQSKQRESLLFEMKIAEDMERYEGTFDRFQLTISDMRSAFLKLLEISGNTDITPLEKDYFSRLYRLLRSIRYREWRSLSTASARAREKQDVHLHLVMNSVLRIEEEIHQITDEVNDIANLFLSRDLTPEAAVFYHTV